MNGGIALDRSAPGQGSTFSFTFDAPTAEGVAPDATNDAPVAHAPGATADEPLAGIRVLLAEDGKDNQRLITFHLKKLGASPELADNGRVAVDAYNALEDQGLTPDLILMDMQMPEMDGYTATAMLRNQGVTTPIIALTAHAMAGDREKCLDAGCDDYLTKPVDRDTLRDAILSHVRNNPDSRRAA
jgi:CheY-like chemotaxis protein